MENENSLASVLKTIRLERGMSLREFGDFLGISHAYLSKLEKGFDSRSGKEIAPTIDILVKIAENLEIPTKDFLECCGYFKPGPSMITAQTKSYGNVEVKTLIEEVSHTIQSAERLTYDGLELTKAEGELIMDALEISMELALKKIKSRSTERRTSGTGEKKL